MAELALTDGTTVQGDFDYTIFTEHGHRHFSPHAWKWIDGDY